MVNFLKALWNNLKFLLIPLAIITPIAFVGALLEFWVGFPYLIYLIIILMITLIVISIIDARDNLKMAERVWLYKKAEEYEMQAQALRERILDSEEELEREQLYTELHETLTMINELRSFLENM